MPIPSRGIGWGTTENLLWQISKQLEGISCQLCDLNNNFITTTTTTTIGCYCYAFNNTLGTSANVYWTKCDGTVDNRSIDPSIIFYVCAQFGTVSADPGVVITAAPTSCSLDVQCENLCLCYTFTNTSTESSYTVDWIDCGGNSQSAELIPERVITECVKFGTIPSATSDRVTITAIGTTCTSTEDCA